MTASFFTWLILNENEGGYCFKLNKLVTLLEQYPPWYFSKFEHVCYLYQFICMLLSVFYLYLCV